MTKLKDGSKSTRALLLALAVLAPLATAGCLEIDDWLNPGPGPRDAGPPRADAPVACPAIKCLTQASIELRPASGTLPSGLHEAVITRDQEPPVRCTFTWPPANDGGPFAHATCEQPSTSAWEQFLLNVGPKQRCGPVLLPDGGNRGSSCELVAGELVEQIAVPGTPTRVRVVQSVGGTAYLDKTFEPAYRDVYGKDQPCYQDCKQAHVEGTF